MAGRGVHKTFLPAFVFTPKGNGYTCRTCTSQGIRNIRISDKRTASSFTACRSRKEAARTTLGLTFFKAKTYCNSLSGESVCRISAGENCTLRSESKVANDKKLIICIQEKNSRIKSYSRYAPYIFPESGKTPYLIILKMKSSPEAP